MPKTKRSTTLLAVLALVAASTLALTGVFAGDDAAPTSAAPTATSSAPAEKAEATATKTASPVHSMMAWVAHQAIGDLDSPCPSCPKAEKAWRTWFAGGADVPLAALRDQLVADGWTADRYVAFFQAMAKAHPKADGDCDEKCGDCDKGCDKGCDDCPSKASGEKGCCGSCGGGCKDGPSKADGASKGCGSCPGGCPEKRATEHEPAGTAAK